MPIVDNLRVGRPDVKITAPSHVPGVPEGNAGRKRAPKGTARRSTGIAPRRHEPIDPRMPNLSPP